MEHVIANAVQARGLHGSSRSRLPAPIEHMEPIAEEKSELAMDIAQAVVEKLDIDRKLDERMKELMLRGDRIFRDIQIRQEQSTEALCRSVGMCLESQRTFHEEHQRLLVAVRDLATMVIPFTPMAGQAADAQIRATAIAEETEELRKQMEDNTRSAFAAATALAQATAATTAPVPAPVPAPAAVQPGAGTFSITLRKADDVSLGLSVNADEGEDKALVVDNVLPGGAVESWNRQCFGDATGERVVVAGDRIVRVNGINGDLQKMLEECTTQRLVKLVIARGPASVRLRVEATRGGSGQAPMAMDLTPEKVSTLRRRAPEFVPAGADAPPLTQTQHLAAPPGLFFPRPDEQSKKADAHALVAGVVSRGYDDADEIVRLQDVAGAEDDEDKEN